MTTFEEDKKALLDQLYSGAFFEQALAVATIDSTGEQTAEAFDAAYDEAAVASGDAYDACEEGGVSDPIWMTMSIIDQLSFRNPDAGPGMPANWYDDQVD